jgi:hypothetical protein
LHMPKPGVLQDSFDRLVPCLSLVLSAQVRSLA